VSYLCYCSVTVSSQATNFCVFMVIAQLFYSDFTLTTHSRVTVYLAPCTFGDVSRRSDAARPISKKKESAMMLFF